MMRMMKHWEIPAGKQLDFEDRLVLEKEERDIIKRIDELREISYEGSLKSPPCDFLFDINVDIIGLEHDLNAIHLSLAFGKRVY